MRWLLALWLVACGGTPEPTVDLPAPWGAYGLPVAEGTVDSVDSSELIVRAPGSFSEVWATWKSALEAQGFEVGEIRAVAGMRFTTATRNLLEYDVILTPRADHVIVHVAPK